MTSITESLPYRTGFQILGLAVVGNLVFKILKNFYRHFVRPGKNLKKFGKWAVITGATDGIGKAYAFALAKQGLSIVLISRTESKLKEVQDELYKKKYSGVDIKYIVCDYSNFNTVAKESIKKELESLEIGILINNVGMSYRYPVYFHELSDDEVTQLLSINIDSTVWMTRMVLPGMLQRKKGTIVNISSISGVATLPLLALYGGAKSLIEKFSCSLNAEYKNSGILVQVQVPFYVATKLAKMRKSFTTPTPTEYVNYAIKFIGYSDDCVNPYFIHNIAGYFFYTLPSFIVAYIANAMHQPIRKRGLKKDSLNSSTRTKKD